MERMTMFGVNVRLAIWAIASLSVAVGGMPAAAQQTNLPAATWTAIAEMGPTLNGELIRKSFTLIRPFQAPRTGLTETANIAYGTDPLQKLDIFNPQSSSGPAPVVVFVHGGGFTGGDKRGLENVPAYFARHGFLGVTIDYRLAPAAHWPEQSLDLGSAIAWVRENAAHYGGAPDKVLLVGHSSGAAVVASYLFDRSIDTPGDGVVGGVLISGPYGYQAPGPRTRAYYAREDSMIAQHFPRAHVGEGKVPVLIVTAEFDPAPLGAESHDLAAALCVSGGKCPPFLSLGGHNHMTEVVGIDTGDDRLGSAIVDFVHAVVK